MASLVDPDGLFGMPADAAADVTVRGTPAAIAERFEALAAIGAHRVVVTVAGGDWFRQVELLAEAQDRLQGR